MALVPNKWTRRNLGRPAAAKTRPRGGPFVRRPGESNNRAASNCTRVRRRDSPLPRAPRCPAGFCPNVCPNGPEPDGRSSTRANQPTNRQEGKTRTLHLPGQTAPEPGAGQARPRGARLRIWSGNRLEVRVLSPAQTPFVRSTSPSHVVRRGPEVADGFSALRCVLLLHASQRRRGERKIAPRKPGLAEAQCRSCRGPGGQRALLASIGTRCRAWSRGGFVRHVD